MRSPSAASSSNVRGFMVYGDYRDDHPLSEIVHAVATGEVDVAAVWGPVAGYFAAKEKPPLVVTSIAGSAEARLPMTFDISMGVRRTDKELKARWTARLSSLAPQIRTILASYGVPVVVGAPSQSIAVLCAVSAGSSRTEFMRWSGDKRR